jgi:asparagine synthetase B (glutamine-hydrolysing)
MAWGLEARVPFLDRAFLEVAMNIDAKEKMFSKGKEQARDGDGRPIMEKVTIALQLHYKNSYSIYLVHLAQSVRHVPRWQGT